jgi:hypothetical protein
MGGWEVEGPGLVHGGHVRGVGKLKDPGWYMVDTYGGLGS